MRTRGTIVAAAALAALTACGSASRQVTTGPSIAAIPTDAAVSPGTTTATNTPAPTTSPEKPALAAGQQGTRADVPWSQVGANWFLATWSNAPGRGAGPPPSNAPAPGPDTLFLIDPAGGRYALESFPQGSLSLTGWSGDGKRALFMTGSGARSDNFVVEQLATGARSTITADRVASGLGVTSPQITAAQFTRPDGMGLLLQLSETPTPGAVTSPAGYVRTDLAGERAAVVVPKGAAGNSGGRAVYSPDGTKVVVSGAETDGNIRVFGNGGTALAALHVPAPYGQCSPTRFTAPATVLVSCFGGNGSRLFAVPLDGSPATPLTAATRSMNDNGDLDALPVGGVTYVEVAGGCGQQYLARLGSDGKTTPLMIPGVDSSDTTLLVGTDATARLAVLSTVGCGTGISLFWFNPGTQAEQILLGPGANGGGVLNAFEFDTAPAP